MHAPSLYLIDSYIEHLSSWVSLPALPSCKAPAYKVGDWARVFGQEDQPHLSEAARVSVENPERDAHRFFKRKKMVLPVPISTLTIPAVEADDKVLTVPYIKIEDYFTLLARKHPKLLTGGLDLDVRAENRLLEFWDHYRHFHGSHEIYKRFSREDCKYIVPILVHGDKGRTLKKSPICCLSFETPFGLPAQYRKSARVGGHKKRPRHDGKLKTTCADRLKHSCPTGSLKRYSSENLETCTVKKLKLNSGCAHVEPEAQLHNSKGHSYLSRFFIVALAKSVYQENSDCISAVLRDTARGLVDLFHFGVDVGKGKTLRAALIGMKGDAEWHVECGYLDRSYLNVGTVNEKAMCPECDAGLPSRNFEDFSDEPEWATTIGSSLPWSAPPPFSVVPFDDVTPASVHRHDFFHVIKYGVARDLCASCIVALGHMGYFDDPNDAGQSIAVDNRLERAYGMFRLWTLAEGKTTQIKHFLKSNFHYQNLSKFPWVNCKGADCVLLLMFISMFLKNCLSHIRLAEDELPLRAMEQSVNGALDFVGICHSHHLFLPRACAATVYQSGMMCLRGFKWCALHFSRKVICVFALRPKAHSLHHILYSIKKVLDQPHAKYVLSPSVFLCENNEDWIGRISRLSRRVSARTVGMRVVQRYLIHMHILTRRAGV